MSDSQLVMLFAVERDGEGRPKLAPPGAEPPTPRQAFERRCFLNAVTDPAAVEELWAAHQKRLAERRAKEPRGRSRRARR